MFALILVAFTTFSLHALEPAPPAEKPAHVKPIIWTKGFFAPLKARFPASKYEFLDQSAQRRDWLEEGYLVPSERDALFHKLGLEPRLQKMDALDKDMLVMGAKAFSLPELVKQYPMLTSAQLSRLKAAIENLK